MASVHTWKRSVRYFRNSYPLICSHACLAAGCGLLIALFIGATPVSAGDAEPIVDTVIFEVTEEPDGVRWTVVQGGRYGITDGSRAQNVPEALFTGMSESGTDPNVLLSVWPGGSGAGRLVLRWKQVADVSGFRRISKAGFSANAISTNWGGPQVQTCPSGFSWRNDQFLRVERGGEFFYVLQTGEPYCWGAGATALFEGSFASLGIIPGVESTVRWDGQAPLQYGLTIRTIATASLTLVLNEPSTSGTNFDFTSGLAGEPDPSAFSLDDASPDDADGVINTQAFTQVIAGTYEVRDLLPAGWRVTASCTGGSDPGTLVDGVLSVAVQAREDVVCTFTHVADAEITVVQETVPEGPQDFGFSGDLGAFSLDDDADPALPGSFSVFVPAGTYSVSQVPVAAFDLMSIDCADAQAVVDQGAHTATLTVASAERVSCTFRNQQRGAISITLDAQPATEQAFAFSGDLGAFTLDAEPADPAWPATIGFDNLPSGEYAVQQSVPPGWGVTGVVCDDDNSDTDAPAASALIRLEPGERVNCQYSNRSAFTDVAIEKTAEQEPGSYELGFHLTVTNHGPAPAENLVVTDPLLAGLIHDSNDCGGIITVDGDAETFTWSIGALAVGEQASCTLWVIDAVQEAFVNQATFTMDQADPEPANDIGAASVLADPREVPAIGPWGALLLILGLATLVLVRARFLSP